MGGYTKLWSKLIISSIWDADDKTRILWVTMLAMADKKGFVASTFKALAMFARINEADCEKALNVLMSPDPNSCTPDDDGRRVRQEQGGWLILNYEKYRNAKNDDPRAISDAERQKRYRNRQNETPVPIPANLTSIDGFLDEWEHYLDHRAAKGVKTTLHAKELMILKLAQRPSEAIKALKTIQERGWTAFEWAWLDKQSLSGPRHTPVSGQPLMPNGKKPYKRNFGLIVDEASYEEELRKEAEGV